DLAGQVTEAFTDRFFYKWGRHYLPSLVRAHQLQVCNNFKDPGVQVYGGKLFEKVRDEMDEVFLKIPPPKPSKVNPRVRGPVRPVNMSSYHNRNNPCFAGECLVQLVDGGVKRVDEVQKGDVVLTTLDAAEVGAKVVCVVKTPCETAHADLVHFDGGLLITPYHPIRVNGTWHFPCHIAKPTTHPCTAVYSFVLDSHHTMVINGVECVTLGHGFEDDVCAHAYFGTRRVVDDLARMEGWECGVVVTRGLVRDPKTDMVCGMEGSLPPLASTNSTSSKFFGARLRLHHHTPPAITPTATKAMGTAYAAGFTEEEDEEDEESGTEEVDGVGEGDLGNGVEGTAGPAARRAPVKGCDIYAAKIIPTQEKRSVQLRNEKEFDMGVAAGKLSDSAVQYYEFWPGDVIVMEYVPKGDLQKFIAQLRDTL
ncbi:hypothetical protein HK104_010122, partial [Borealophlyctis nickersoniae]